MIDPLREEAARTPGSRYLVLASLPHIARFDRVRRLPIGRETLAARLALLPVEEALEVGLATSFLGWQRQPAGRTDQGVLAQHAHLMRTARATGLRRVVEFHLGVGTVVAALRRRALGLPAPRRGEAWGVGPWVRLVERRYAEPDFGLGHVLPWLPAARGLLEGGDAVGLERLLFTLLWDELDRLAHPDRFGFDAVLAYVFQWDVVDRWLRQDAGLASERIDALAQEALGGFDHLFDRD